MAEESRTRETPIFPDLPMYLSQSYQRAYLTKIKKLTNNRTKTTCVLFYFLLGEFWRMKLNCPLK